MFVPNDEIDHPEPSLEEYQDSQEELRNDSVFDENFEDSIQHLIEINDEAWEKE